MNDIAFRLEVSVCDQTGRVRAAYLQVRKGQAAETREVVTGTAFADYNADGQLIGVEFLAPCAFAVVDKITLNEPEPVREFFRQLRWEEAEVSAVPDESLSEHQRVLKARQLAAATGARKEILRKLRLAHVLAKPSSSATPLPPVAPRFGPQQLVYFFEDVLDGRIKIGTGFDVESRMKSIASLAGRELRCLGYVEGGKAAEGALHVRFRHLRLLGEWFTPAEDLRAYIRERAQPVPASCV